MFPYHKAVVALALLVREYPPPDSLGQRHGLTFLVVAWTSLLAFGKLNHDEVKKKFFAEEFFFFFVFWHKNSS